MQGHKNRLPNIRPNLTTVTSKREDVLGVDALRSNLEGDTEGTGIEIHPNKLTNSPRLKIKNESSKQGAVREAKEWGPFKFENLLIPSLVDHGSTQNRSRARVDCS